MQARVIRAGLLGLPLAKSRSPEIFRVFSKICGSPIIYEARETAPECLTAAVESARAEGWRGFNVTLPHKRAVYEMLSLADPAARAVRAVNAVRFGRAGLEGMNTDAQALLHCLDEHGVSVGGRRAAVFGAGGAAGAAGWALGRAGAAQVTLHARNQAEAAALARALDAAFPETAFSAAPFSAPPPGCGVLVNATPLGMYLPGMPPCAPAAGSVCVDLAYTRGGTELIKAAAAAGARVIEGFEVLVWQAALSLNYWTGLPSGDIVKFKQDAAALLAAEERGH